MNNIDIDVITNYFCNFSCGYCFLHDLRNTKQIIDMNKLQNQFDEVSEKYTIGNINLYGGEISLLPMNYVKQLIDLCTKYAQVNVVTNFTNNKFNEFLNKENVTISTSINEERSCNTEIEYTLLTTDIKKLSLIQVVTPSLLNKSPKEILDHLELFKKSVSFLQYSPAKHAKIIYEITNLEFSNFIKKIIEEYTICNYSFNITNINQLIDVIENRYNPSMKSILFINPFNEYCSITYDDNLEYFKMFNSLKNWETACKKESNYYEKKCESCNYYGRCYTEHIKEWKDNDECCGMKSLVEWYEKNIYKNN